MNMNIQALMREAQKVQKDLEKTQKDLENTEYTGESSLVNVVFSGDMKMKSIKINCEESLDKDDVEMLEDMVLLAVNDAINKINKDKESKLGKYGKGLSGLM